MFCKTERIYCTSNGTFPRYYKFLERERERRARERSIIRAFVEEQVRNELVMTNSLYLEDSSLNIKMLGGVIYQFLTLSLRSLSILYLCFFLSVCSLLM